jgi:hypothetical protein
MAPVPAVRTRWLAAGLLCGVLLGGGAAGAGLSSGARAVFVAITPCRVIDTRPDSTVGGRNTPLGSGETHHVVANGGNCVGQIPADVSGVSMNVTTVGATQPTFITVWATGAAQPLASSLNPAPGQPPTPNAVITSLSVDGRFDIYNLAGSVHVLADINGYFVDHNHDDRYYTKSDADSRYLGQGAPIVETVSPGAFGVVAATSPSAVNVAGPMLASSGDGQISIPFDGPVSVGGSSYKLDRVEYCLALKNGGYVTGVVIASDDLFNGVPDTVILNDLTDRTANRCYTIAVPASGARSFGAIFTLAGTTTANSIFLSGIRTSWSAVGP